MRQGISNGEMSTKERSGWGIYHEMISPEGSYAYVVDLTNGVKEAKYDEFYGAALSTMEDFGDYLNTQVNKIFTQIISGEKPLSYFEEFAADYNKILNYFLRGTIFGILREILSLSPFGKSSSIQGCLSCWLSLSTKCSIRP